MPHVKANKKSTIAVATQLPNDHCEILYIDRDSTRFVPSRTSTTNAMHRLDVVWEAWMLQPWPGHSGS